MWVTHTERAWRRKEEAEALAEAARQAEARIASASNALRAIQTDAAVRCLLDQAGYGHLALGRSSRVGRSGVVEGLCVLEAVVVGRAVARVLSDPLLVRWLSRRYRDELASLNVATEPDGHPPDSLTR